MPHRVKNLPLLLGETPSPGVRLFRLNRPEVLNALSTALCKELAVSLGSVPRGTRVLVIAGAGEKAFCAGADLKERASLTTKTWLAHHKAFERLATALSKCRLPTIAQVNGIAYGGGCELALWCDLIVASEQASFAQPEVKRGIIPGMGGTQTLQRRVGPALAKEMIFTGRPISAREALACGLVNRVVPADQLAEETLAIARAIAENAPLAVREAKAAMQRGAALPMGRALKEELKGYAVSIRSKDRDEGLRAFLEKRAPRFQGH